MWSQSEVNKLPAWASQLYPPGSMTKIMYHWKYMHVTIATMSHIVCT